MANKYNKKLRYLDNIEEQYKISYRSRDVLGNGAFGTVRLAKKRAGGLD